MNIIKTTAISIVILAAGWLSSGCSGMLDAPAYRGVNAISSIGGYMVYEGGVLDIAVTLNSRPTANVTIPVSSSDTTEASLSVSSLTFTPSDWNEPHIITVAGLDDLTADGNQIISLVFGAGVSTDPDYSGYVKPSIPVTVIDIHTPSIVVSPQSGLVTTEFGDTDEFYVVLSSRPVSNVLISSIYSTNKNEGVVDSSLNSILFTPANYNTPQKVTVKGVDDAVKDGNVIYTVAFAASQSSDPKYNNLTASPVSVTNIDNDSPGVFVSRLSNNTTESGQKATFTVRLATLPKDDVIVTINEKNDPKNSVNQEGTIDKKTLTFTTGDWNIPQEVTVTGVGDNIMDGLIQYAIKIENATSSGDPEYNGMRPYPDYVTVNNIDIDVAGFAIDVSGNVTKTGSQAVTVSGLATDDMGNLDPHAYSEFSVCLRSKPLKNVTITLTSLSTTKDGIINPSTPMTFTPADWNLPKTVYVTGDSNGANEGNHDYSIKFSISSTDEKYGNTNFVKAPSVSIHSCDNDNVNSIVACRRSGGGLSTSESGGKASFWLITKTKPLGDIFVDVDTSDTSEGTFPASVTITDSNWNTMLNLGSNKVEATGVDDLLLDGNVQYTAKLGPSSGDIVGFYPPNVTLWNIDNEKVLVFGAKSGDTSEDGASATFSVRLDDSITPTSSVTFSIACKAGSLECGSLSHSSLTFTPANCHVPQVITVTGMDDWRVDGSSAVAVSFGEIESADLRLNGYQPSDYSPMNNLDNDRLIWVTAKKYKGNFNATGGMDPVDAVCQETAWDDNAPANIKSVTYKALIVHSAYRVATTSGIDKTGQTNWVLNANTAYFLKDGANPPSNRILTTNSFGIFSFGTLVTAFSNAFGADEFWTGMNSNWTAATDRCGDWSDDVGGILGRCGKAGVKDSESINSVSRDCKTAEKFIICVQQ